MMGEKQESEDTEEELQKKIEEELKEIVEVDEDSDLPVHERYVKDKKIKK